jgi:hypothetical protein
MAWVTLWHNTHHRRRHPALNNCNTTFGKGRAQFGLEIATGVNLKSEIRSQWPILSLMAVTGHAVTDARCCQIA